MKIRFLFTMTLLAIIASLLCFAQEFKRPAPPSAETEKAFLQMLGIQQKANDNSKGNDSETFEQFVIRNLKPDHATENTTSERAIGNRTVRNDTSTSRVRITPNHPDGIYEEDDPLVLTITSDRKGFVYLVNLRIDGTYYCFFPRDSGDDNQIDVGKSVVFPPEGSKNDFVIEAPFGEDKIFAIVSKETLNWKLLESPSFYKDRGFEQAGSRGIGNHPKIETAEDDFPIFTTTIHTYPRGQKPAQSPKRRYVLIVYGSDYLSEQFHPLPECENDSQLMKLMFEKYGKVDGIRVIGGKGLTKANVCDAFDELSRESRPGDEIFIVWTGHCGRRPDTSGNRPTEFTHYLVLYGSQMNDPSSLLTDTELEHLLDVLDGRRVAVFLDACYSEKIMDRGTGTRSVGSKSPGNNGEMDFFFFANMVAKSQDGSKGGIRPNQAAILCSSEADQKSWVNKTVPCSTMLWCVAKHIFDSAGAVSFDDICASVVKTVPPIVWDQYKITQQPVYVNQIGTIYVKP